MRFNLLNQLKKHKPFDSVEEENTQRAIDFLKNHKKHAFDRDYTKGHITASCYLFNEDCTKLLMTHHKQFDEWYQLGGHSDGDKNSLRVAKREGWEESGIKKIRPISKKIADVDVQFIDAYEPHNMPDHYHYDMRYFFITKTEEFIVSDESYDLRWVDYKEFRRMATIPEAQRIVKKWELLLEHYAEKNNNKSKKLRLRKTKSVATGK